MRNFITKSFTTAAYHGYNIKYSPFRRNLLACAASENYGIAGRGRLYVLDIEGTSGIKIISTFEWTEGLFDVAWSEVNPQLLVTSCGDGSIQLWDFQMNRSPVAYYRIHEKEVYSVEWNPKNAYTYILSASWDGTVKLWDPFTAKEVGVFQEHTDQVYEGTWCPHHPEVFASVSGDTTLRLWDIRSQSKSTSCKPHHTEVLCCDWAKDDTEVLAVGTTDGKIIGWDVRQIKDPLFVLVGHEYAIRRLKFSPFERGTLASVSYDFTTRFWYWTMPYPVQVHREHTEFVYGLDFSPFKPGEACDCAWDSLIHIYNEDRS